MVRVPVRLTSSQLIPMRLLASPLLVLLNRAPDIQALQRGYLSRSFHRRNEWSLPHYNAQSCRMHAASGPLELDRENDGGDNRQPSPPSLLENLSPSPDCKVEQMSSTDLAYVGDAVYELSVRSWAVWPPKRTSDLQLQVVELVRAERQSGLLRQLKADPAFACTLTEQQVLARGRNSVSGSSRNRRNPSAYQDATALEALIGYLFITDSDRCRTLLGWIRNRLEAAVP